MSDIYDILMFDTFPMKYKPNTKIILTSLLHLENKTLPQKLPMIYTTFNIAKPFVEYCRNKYPKVVNRSNLDIIEPYKCIDLVNNKGLNLQMLFCSSEDQESQNLMVLIRENDKLKYIHAGNFMDICFALRNETFTSWISNGVEKLFVNIKRANEALNINDIDQMQKVFNKIEEILNCHKKSEFHICLPLFGYENFIVKLSHKFPNRIAKQLTHLLFYMFENRYKTSETSVMKKFCDINVATIFLFEAKTNYQYEAELKSKSSNVITINIKNDRTKCADIKVNPNNHYYELHYSPEPSPFQLKLLCMLVKPKHIFAIINQFNTESRVPQYLKELCVGFKK